MSKLEQSSAERRAESNRKNREFQIPGTRQEEVERAGFRRVTALLVLAIYQLSTTHPLAGGRTGRNIHEY